MKHYSAVNASDCGWLSILDEQAHYPALQGEQSCGWLIIGGGYTGLSAAHRLAELCPEDKVILVDAEGIGEGASARNSGFIVDSTLNDGQASHSAAEAYLKKYQLNLAGMARLKSQIKQFDIDCDWDESGKYHSAHTPKNFKTLEAFDRFLDQLNIQHSLLDQTALNKRLGINHYQMSVHTQGGVLINPAGLSQGLAKALAQYENIALFSNSPVLNMTAGKPNTVQCTQGSIKAKRVIVAVNALMPRLGYKPQNVFPLTLSGGLTRPLTDSEYAALGRPEPWGVLSAVPMGATVRLTNDKRILLRNTVESKANLKLTQAEINAARAQCLASIQARFPMLPNIELAHYWSGNVCISRNSKPVFEKTADGLYLAGCYNAGGIAMGSLFGKLMVDYALGKESENLSTVLKMEQANRMPPKIFSNIGIKMDLAWRRRRGRCEA